jgi:hypothetical protein
MRCIALEEALRDIDHQEQAEDQVSNFVYYCLKLLSDHDAAIKLTHMLTSCMGEKEKLYPYPPHYQKEMCARSASKSAQEESSR